MGLFSRNNLKGGFIDEIRCDEPSYLIWKWHPSGSQTGANNRENAIRWGSSLRVKDGEVAVFVYKQKDGTMQDFIVGPFDQTIKTTNFPILASIVGLAYEGGTPFQAEVYFINIAQMVQVRFGVPFFDVYDPGFADFGVPVAVRGTINFRIEDYKRFVKLHRLIGFGVEEFKREIRDVVNRYVKDAVTNAPAEHDIPVIQLETKTAQINDIVELNIKNRLNEDFGVSVSGVDINAIELDKTSSGYYKLMAITQEITTAAVKAEAEVHIKDIKDKQKIDVEHLAESLRIQREEAQYAQRMQTRTTNFAAYQTEKQAEVGKAGAEALGKMGASGAGNVNLGTDGFNMAAMMASMAVGGVVGQNIAGTMNSMMSGMNQTVQAGEVPPPIPQEAYYVAVSGQATGPFEMNQLKAMVENGQLLKETLVWKKGMAEWEKAICVEKLKVLFEDEIPPVPER